MEEQDLVTHDVVAAFAVDDRGGQQQFLAGLVETGEHRIDHRQAHVDADLRHLGAQGEAGLVRYRVDEAGGQDVPQLGDPRQVDVGEVGCGSGGPAVQHVVQHEEILLGNDQEHPGLQLALDTDIHSPDGALFPSHDLGHVLDRHQP